MVTIWLTGSSVHRNIQTHTHARTHARTPTHTHLYHYLVLLPVFSTHQVERTVAPHAHAYTTHAHRKSSAHSCTADTCLTQGELSIFSPQGLSCLCVGGDEESTVEGKVWMRRLGGAEDVETRKGRRGVCLNLDVLSCQRNTSRLEQKITVSCTAPSFSIHATSLLATTVSSPA